MPPIKPFTQFYFNRGTGTVPVSTTGYVDITGLSADIGANETWHYRILCPITGATNGCKFQVTGPASPTLVQMFLSSNQAAINQILRDALVTAFSTPNTTAVHSSSATGYTEIDLLVVNGATAGTIQLQFATGTGTNTITAQANRFIEGRRIS